MPETKLQNGTTSSPSTAIPTVDPSGKMPGVSSILSGAVLPAVTSGNGVNEPTVNPTSGRETLRTWGNEGYIQFHSHQPEEIRRFGAFVRDDSPYDSGLAIDRHPLRKPTDAQYQVRNEIVSALGLPLGSVDAFNLDTDSTLAGDRSAISRGADGKEYVRGGLSVTTKDGTTNYIHFAIPYPTTPGGTVEIDGRSLAAKDVPEFVEQIAKFDRSTNSNLDSLLPRKQWSHEQWMANELANANAALARSTDAPSPRARHEQIFQAINDLEHAVSSFQKLEPEARAIYAPELQRVADEAVTKGKQLVETAAYSEFSDAHSAFFGMRHIRDGLQSQCTDELRPAARHLAELQLQRAEHETTLALSQEKPGTRSGYLSAPDPLSNILSAEYFVRNYGLTDLQPQIDSLDARLRANKAPGRDL